MIQITRLDECADLGRATLLVQEIAWETRDLVRDKVKKVAVDVTVGERITVKLWFVPEFGYAEQWAFCERLNEDDEYGVSYHAG